MAMTILLAALAAQLLPAPGTLRWEQVADESSGPSFIDPASLERAGDVVLFLNRSDRRVVDRTGVHMFVVRVAMDCRPRTIGIEATDGYGADGRLIGSRVAPASAVAPVAGIASLTALVARACRRGAR